MYSCNFLLNFCTSPFLPFCFSITPFFLYPVLFFLYLELFHLAFWVRSRGTWSPCSVGTGRQATHMTEETAASMQPKVDAEVPPKPQAFQTALLHIPQHMTYAVLTAVNIKFTVLGVWRCVVWYIPQSFARMYCYWRWNQKLHPKVFVCFNMRDYTASHPTRP
jgi:hypothetical protein